MTTTTARARAYRAAFFAACLAADALVLRDVLTEVRMEPGQFRRGYFEPSGGDIELVADDAIDPDMLPAFALTGDDLGVSPGMTVVLPLVPGPGGTRGGAAAEVDDNMHYSLVTTGD